MSIQTPITHEVVYRSGLQNCTAYGLALESAGIRYSIEFRDGDYAIVVATADAPRARQELDAYAGENPPVAPPVFDERVLPAHTGWIGAFAYVAVLAVFTALQHNNVFSSNWLPAGRNNAGLVRDGELWRVFTALTLHADVAHLVSNMLIGGLIGLFVGQVMGSGRAWLCILLCGAAGNLLSAMLRPPGHSSIGASTAVFAALGILAGQTWSERQRLRGGTLAKLAPIVGGVILLSYLGTDGERTDVLSHVTGFCCGMLLGAIYPRLGERIAFSTAAQTAMGIGAIALLALSWAFALS